MQHLIVKFSLVHTVQKTSEEQSKCFYTRIGYIAKEISKKLAGISRDTTTSKDSRLTILSHAGAGEVAIKTNLPMRSKDTDSQGNIIILEEHVKWFNDFMQAFRFSPKSGHINKSLYYMSHLDITCSGLYILINSNYAGLFIIQIMSARQQSKIISSNFYQNCKLEKMKQSIRNDDYTYVREVFYNILQNLSDVCISLTYLNASVKLGWQSLRKSGCILDFQEKKAFSSMNATSFLYQKTFTVPFKNSCLIDFTLENRWAHRTFNLEHIFLATTNVQESRFYAMIDTEASSSYLNRTILKYPDNFDQKKINFSKQETTLQFYILGLDEKTNSRAKRKFIATFKLVDSSMHNVDMLLGLDFLTYYGVVIDFSQSIFFLHSQNHKLAVEYKPPTARIHNFLSCI